MDIPEYARDAAMERDIDGNLRNLESSSNNVSGAAASAGDRAILRTV